MRRPIRARGIRCRVRRIIARPGTMVSSTKRGSDSIGVLVRLMDNTRTKQRVRYAVCGDTV